MAVEQNVNIIGLGMQIFWILGTVLVLGFIGFGGYLGVRYLQKLAKYRYSVDILEQVGKEGNQGTTDLAREVREEGKHFIELLKTRDASGKRMRIGIPDPSHLVPFGSRKKIYLSKVGGLVTAMEVVRNSPANFESNWDDLMALIRWREQDHIRALDTYSEKPSFWQQHQQVILFGSMMISIIVLFFVLLVQLQNIEVVVDMTQRIT